MTLDSLLVSVASVQTITTTVDSYGGKTESAGTATTLQCRIRMLNTRERQYLSQMNIEATHRIYFPGTASIAKYDKITISSTEYRVVSVPNNVNLLSHHIEVDVLQI